MELPVAIMERVHVVAAAAEAKVSGACYKRLYNLTGSAKTPEARRSILNIFRPGPARMLPHFVQPELSNVLCRIRHEGIGKECAGTRRQSVGLAFPGGQSALYVSCSAAIYVSHALLLPRAGPGGSFELLWDPHSAARGLAPWKGSRAAGPTYPK